MQEVHLIFLETHNSSIKANANDMLEKGKADMQGTTCIPGQAAGATLLIGMLMLPILNYKARVIFMMQD
jgi:hypothetical protein